ncbi:hypothetical protein CCACVL1_10753 [Corchorus capsularis]|uniref:Uncharacterized protein n=1 Tax=Corchorus capsularis TaxID=210143 RepID=A0A1R3IPS1_COCAP|nr:hypothetical protein CCACVL1_10753 [Corchorus capsularis]
MGIGYWVGAIKRRTPIRGTKAVEQPEVKSRHMLCDLESRT